MLSHLNRGPSDARKRLRIEADPARLLPILPPRLRTTPAAHRQLWNIANKQNALNGPGRFAHSYQASRENQCHPVAVLDDSATLREQVHHGAEISLLRDLYRNRETLGNQDHGRQQR
jgi:hypothetical protein